MLLHKPRYGMSGRSQIKIIVGKVTEIKLQQWKIYTHTNKLIWLVRSSRRRSRICNCGRFSFLFYNTIYRQNRSTQHKLCPQSQIQERTQFFYATYNIIIVHFQTHLHCYFANIYVIYSYLNSLLLLLFRFVFVSESSWLSLIYVPSALPTNCCFCVVAKNNLLIEHNRFYIFRSTWTLRELCCCLCISFVEWSTWTRRGIRVSTWTRKRPATTHKAINIPWWAAATTAATRSSRPIAPSRFAKPSSSSTSSTCSSSAWACCSLSSASAIWPYTATTIRSPSSPPHWLPASSSRLALCSLCSRSSTSYSYKRRGDERSAPR